MDDSGPSTAWDETQRAALAAAAAQPAVVVLGAPGTGKSELAVEIAARAVEDEGLEPTQVLLLTTSRRTAATARERLARRLGRTVLGVSARSVQSAAFAIIAHDCRLRGLPAPVLATGPEQDAVLASLLSGHAQGTGARVPWPSQVGDETRALRGFRDELRDLLMRCAERDVAPVDLAELGQAQGRPEWVAAAHVYQEYLDVSMLSRGTPDLGPRYDAATIVGEATQTLRAWAADDEPGRLRWRLVVVDDYQEATAAVATLLAELAADGARVVVLGDPDSAVQGFRGARPGLLGRAAARRGARGGASTNDSASTDDGASTSDRAATGGELDATQVVLGTAWRQSAGLRAATAAVTEHVSVVSGAAHRRAVAPQAGAAAREASPAELATEEATGEAGDRGREIELRVARSVGQEHGLVARTLREEHVRGGTPWGSLAVVARSSAQVRSLRRALAAAGVPVRTVGLGAALRDEPAARALLLAVEVAARSDEGVPALDEETAVELLASPYGGLDPLSVRRLRRTLVAVERTAGGSRSSGELIVSALLAPGLLDDVPADLAVGPRRLAAVLAAANQAVTSGTEPHLGLWSLWQVAGVAETWRHEALRDGAAAQRADHDLDVVLALLRDAEFYTERTGGATIGQLAEHLLAQDLAADSLGARGALEDAVAVVSPAEAAGREWDVVVVAGVQDGTWPDLRLRDSLLGAQALADLVDGRGAGDDPRAARRSVLDDELRMFAVAVSRARRRLVVTAVDNDEEERSVFCDLVAPDGPLPVTREDLVPLDLRGLVTTARARLTAATAREGSSAQDWAALLASLALEGVREADPRWWYGVAAPSTMEGLVDDDAQVRVSPSKLSQVHTCSLRWALESAGGVRGESVTAGLGTLVHSIAQQHPTAGATRLAEVLDERWDELGLRPGWPTTQLRARAGEMIRRLGAFQEGRPAPVAVEQGFDVVVGRARLRGSMDRVDRADGGLVVTDYKTGRTTLSGADARVDPQLATYQLAAATGSGDDEDAGAQVLGARLVYLDKGAKGPTLREQPGIDSWGDPGWAADMIDQAAQIMSSAQFWAVENPGCGTCGLRRSCPVREEGRPLVPPRGPEPADAWSPAPVSDFSTNAAREARAWPEEGARVQQGTTTEGDEA